MVLRAPFQQSVSTALAADPGHDLIVATAAAAAALPLDRIHALAPRAKLVLLLDAVADRLAADPSAGAARAALLAAAAASDYVLARTRAGAAGLRAAGPGSPRRAGAGQPATAAGSRWPAIGYVRSRAGRRATSGGDADEFTRDLTLILAALELPVIPAS